MDYFNDEKITNPHCIYEKSIPLSEIQLVFDYRAQALCRFGCGKYGKKATCPPYIPNISFFRRALTGYDNVYMLGRKYPYSDGLFQSYWRNYSTNEVHTMLLNKEIELFKMGYVYAKAFIGGSCKNCPDGACHPIRCSVPNKGRIPLEGTGCVVFKIMKELQLEYEEPPVNYFWRIGGVFY